MWFDLAAALAAVENGRKGEATDCLPATPARLPPVVTYVATPFAAKREQTGRRIALGVADVADVAMSRMATPDPLGARRYAGGRPGLPSAPPICTKCGVADWTVSLTKPSGFKYHVACGLGAEPKGRR
jgi:hypothetical protein